ncbi:MAG: hypothetical protein IT190_00045 [Microbacteriaceae bacterium]|nr:hypothetical protein [Microbacteriaceae bacterium]
MRTTVDLSDELFHQLKARAVQENLSLKMIIEKSGYEYLRRPLYRWGSDDITLPSAGDGTGHVLVDPATWWDDINERA